MHILFRPRICFALLFLSICVLLSSPAHAQRVALLIGNADYKAAPLKFPRQDVLEMKEALESVGFAVQTEVNLDQKSMKRVLRDFGTRAQGADLALLYYSGHANQVGNENFLIPIGAQIEKEADFDLEAVSGHAMLRQITSAKPRAAILVLDACRDNPFAASKGVGKGLQRMDAPTGTMIAFSTTYNNTASDNGLYAKVLAQQIKTPGLELVDVFRNTTAEVMRLSGGRQEPRLSELALTDRVYLVSQSGNAPLPTVPAKPQQADPMQAIVANASANPSTPREQTVIKVGHVGPITGAIAHLGSDNENGARLAIEELNQRGLIISGKSATFELITKDDAADPATAVRAARELVNAGVLGVVGHLNSGATIPAAPTYNRAGIPMISPAATNPRLTQLGYANIFRLVLSDTLLVKGLAQYASEKLRVRSVAVVDDQTVYGRGSADEFAASMIETGAHVLARQYTTANARDFQSIINNLKRENPELVFWGGMDTTAGLFLKQMRENGIQAKLMSGDGICTLELPQIARQKLNSGEVICAEAGGVQESEEAPMNSFKNKFRQRFGKEVQIYAPYTYDAVNLLVHAMVAANSSDPAIYLPYLTNSDYRGVTGRIRFNDKGDIKNGAMTIYTFDGSQRVLYGVGRLK